MTQNDMNQFVGNVKNRDIEEEMKKSYIDYAMSVIISRALPDVRDGMKPVHRRILHAMNEMGLYSNKAYKKSASVVGEVLGKYHPHGDAAIYNSIVRMAQDFAMRYQLVNGHGNFGSIDGDSAAAMRYTEVKMTKISETMMADIKKDTVDFIPNYDGSMKEPVVLPSRVPGLLVNGSSGIAVGMATNIPPHNLNEICNGVIGLIDNPDLTIDDLMEHIPGPDFPTSAFICGNRDIRNAYKTGRGRVILRGKTHVETNKNRKSIIIDEIPYAINKSKLVMSIADLVKDKKIEGISDLRDESNFKGIRVVIDLKMDANPQVIENLLYKHTTLQSSVSIILLALVDNQPKVLNLKECLVHFINHRKNVITRRTLFELDKAEKRAHIIEGLFIAIDNIDRVIEIIRASSTVDIARKDLIEEFSLSEAQANAILEMRLSRLVGLERQRLEEEYKALMETITWLKSILESQSVLMNVVKEEIEEVQKQYGDARKSQFIEEIEAFNEEDLIKDEDILITISYAGYIKRQKIDEFHNQKRGGKGIIAGTTREEDFIQDIYAGSTHDYILFFTTKGKMYWLKAYKLPEGSRTAKGKAMVNLLNLEADERITAIIPVKEFSEDKYLVMATKKGMIKKTHLSEYGKTSYGIKGIVLSEDDDLIGVNVTDDTKEIMLATRNGKIIHFDEKGIRTTGRVSKGVIGIRMEFNDEVTSMNIVSNVGNLLTITENGYGKRTALTEYRKQGRGGKGIKNIIVDSRNGRVVASREVEDDDEIMIITQKGMTIRTSAKAISVISRATKGVRLIRLNKDDIVVGIAKIIKESEDDE